MKSPGGVFIGDAASRLLPMSIPFRYFGAAVVFHLLAWLAMLAGAEQLPHYSGGLGWPLAALHLVTLGVLTTTAIGASLQLLPVATRQTLRSLRWPTVIWWLHSMGVLALTLGMGLPSPQLLGVGGAAVLLALLAWAWLLAGNLRGARGMPAVVAHGWAALAALLLTLATALSLVALYLGVPLLERTTALALHMTFAAFGFMGLLAFGLSYILLPMFLLAPAPQESRALGSCLLAVAALALAAAAAFGVLTQPLRVAALALGLAAAALHLQLMRQTFHRGMRREFGRSLRLMQIGWGCLLASLATALAVVLDASLPAAPTLFALLAIGGWLLSFLFGVLQRILPFLASMHASRSGARPPTPSMLTAKQPLDVHFGCHLTAVAGLALAVWVGSSAVAFVAASVGLLGAVAFASFFVILLRRLRYSRASAPLPPSRSRLES